ncbi:LOW QUALITY PROTEIN: hypothetical protein Cgig2_025776 [Carnegiea gigantea]|uniref:Uncharacterized protein n=1 Tax=Carnegiea gigantea TaxID=171969 RepID=A0A9Q1GS21_9CARY|nr:LOW QUALITY PROTEIN: hypothetical protein Cgig2_025776 [Carnegiea gigantea]
MPKGDGSSCTESPLKGSIMDEEFEFVPKEAERSMEDSVSLVEETCEDVRVFASDGGDATIINNDSTEDRGKGENLEEEEATNHGRQTMDGRGIRGVVPMSVGDRCTMENICKFNKMEAIEGNILKPLLEYRPFAIQRDLTTGLVKVWVSWRKAFKLAWRLVPFSIYNVTLFANMKKIVEFHEDDLSVTELARMI